MTAILIASSMLIYWRARLSSRIKRIKQWLHEVFVGTGDFRAVYFWAATVPLAIIVFIPWMASHLPPYLPYVPAGGLLIGFIVCNFSAFSRASVRAEAAAQRLSGLSIDLTSVAAGEHVCPKDITASGVEAHHSVVIDLTLAVRNHDGSNASSIELVTCTTNLQPEPCDEVYFRSDLYNNIREHHRSYRSVPAGVIRQLGAVVVCHLPISETHISATKVTGVVELRDNRKTPFMVSFSSDLIKNPVTLERSRFR